ncbi:MAG: YceI family protein [Bacteroidia bacterium]|nr:YceI family protein [Bacteroidia bacterium]
MIKKAIKTVSIFLFLLLYIDNKSQIYSAKANATEVSFLSEAPLENIEAVNKGGIVVLNANGNQVQARITIMNFKFKNALMEEHFNENYMESDKYPNAFFKGRIIENVDYSRQGEQNVNVEGELEIHGVKKQVILPAKINIKGKEIEVYSKFKVKVADYNIKVPSLYVKNIAEEVDVTIKSTLEPFTKK